MPAKRATYKSINSYQKGFIHFPSIIILLVVILGLAIAIGLVQVPNIFKSKADEVAIKFSGDGVVQRDGSYLSSNRTVKVTLTSPLQDNIGDGYPVERATPVFTDDMENSKSDNLLVYENIDAQTYVNGTYEILLRRPEANYEHGIFKRDLLSEFTTIFDGKLSGEEQGFRRIGLAFGAKKDHCDYGSESCYRLYLNLDGTSSLGSQQNSVEPNFSEQDYKIAFREGDWYTFRVDRSKDKLKAWIKGSTGGWQKFWESDLDVNIGQGKRLGFLVAHSEPGEYTARGNFDNIKVYRLGDVPEPETSGMYYRISEDATSINSDPNGERVRWQPMTSNPITLNYTFSSNTGEKYMFAQFKSGNGQTTQVFQNTISLVVCVQAPCPGDPTAEPQKTPDTRDTRKPYSACGKSGYLAKGYDALTTCSGNTYLVVDQYEDWLEPICRVVPPGFVRDAADACKIVSQNATNVCLANNGYQCANSNGKTRLGKTCNTYQGSFNKGCSTDNAYPYCFSGCN